VKDRTVELQDSRRLTGPNLIADGAGAVIDGSIKGLDVDDVLDAWRERARAVLSAVGLADQHTAERAYEGGATVFLSAPIDALYAATEVNEWAWSAAAADLGAGPAVEALDSAAPRLRRLIDDERNPALQALKEEALRRGVTFLSDDDHASIGTGTGSRTWPVTQLPGPDEVPWSEVHDVPCALVTGTNGKTTTVRMLSAIGEATGYVVGFTCTDGIFVGGTIVDAGDWSGPGGARTVLRDRRVEVAILETARGGLLRRGLALDRADGVLVTNVAADHLGEWGVQSVDDVAVAKLIVAKAVRHGAPLVVNADDPHLSHIARGLARPLTWIAVDEAPRVRTEAALDDVAWILEDGWLVRLRDGGAQQLVEANAIPATLGGAATFNVRNALGAASLADALGLDDESIRRGLLGFDASPTHSPGRANLFDLGGVQVMVDFVHNAHGFEAMAHTVRGLSPKRIGVMIGHAGDRDDGSIREMVRAAWALEPERVAVKEMAEYLRGRELGQVPAVMRAELSVLGMPEQAVSTHDGEVDAACALLEWASPGDFLLLSSQSDRDGVLALVQAVAGSAWKPGDPLP
jgi:UDP-N-acetylmuramyl tripeptide synthase